MTSAKYISQSLFSSNSNPGYSGFALWRDRALRSPEIAIAHLSQGLRSSYHGERGSFEFLSLQYAWQSWCPLNIEVWGALGFATPPPSSPLRPSRLGGSHKELVTCHQISYHGSICQLWQTVAPQLPPTSEESRSSPNSPLQPDSIHSLACLYKQIYFWMDKPGKNRAANKKLNNCMPLAKDKDLLCFAGSVCLFAVHRTSWNLNFPFVPCSQQRSKIGLPHLINTQTHLDNFCMTLTQLKSF